MEFEWVPAKSERNLEERGIDFADATAVFDDPDRIERTDDRRDYGEVRIKTIGRTLEGTVLVVVYTIRNDVTRLISARRADEPMVRVQRRPDGTLVKLMPDGSERLLESRTDWARVSAMSDEEIEAAANADPDNPPLTDDELDRFQRVPNPKHIRQRLQLTQEQFAARFQVPLGALRDWEQGASESDSAAKTLLRVIDRDPEAVVRALSGTR